MTDLDWSQIDGITQGRIGRTMTTCPLCSANRRTAQKRHSKVLAVTLIEPEFAVYYCNHCEAQGYCRPDTPTRHITVIAERQRLQEQAKRHAESEKQDRTRQALTLWNEGQPGRGSPVEDYLYYTRGIGDWLDTFPFLDEVFRYHPNCPFGGERLPCMLALVRDIKTDKPLAVHRTALTRDAQPQRIDRKSLGPVAGGAIKISPDFDVHSGLLIGEGIETVLSASKLLKFKPVWSLIDKNGVSKFPAMVGIESITIAVDNDLAGRQAAAECVERLTQAGVEVITAQTNLANDFNDLIRGANNVPA
jgi:putative DNA primase/helicase